MKPNNRKLSIETLAVHAGQDMDPVTGAVIVPIYQTSTYGQEAPGVHKGYDYSRTTNKTREAYEAAVAALEGGKWGIAFASGLAATSTLLDYFQPGDHIVAVDDLYGGSFRIFSLVREKSAGLKFSYVDFSNVDNVAAAITPNTKMIWIETPTNPLLKIVDLEKVIALAKKKNILVCVDNTFASPYLQRPLDLGADISLHSATKYLNGHSDVISGVLVVKDNEELGKKLKYLQNAVGAVPGPFDCFLVSRGIKTLPVRMERHCDNAEKIAEFLKGHKGIEKVMFPGLKEHPGHEIAKKQMKRFGGMLSIYLKGGLEETKRFAQNLKIFTLAESLGAAESLANHPVSMTHGSIPKETRDRIGVTDNLVRLSVGLESADDLIYDLKEALA